MTSVDPVTLSLQMTGLLAAEAQHVREVLFDEVEIRLPEGAARVNIQLSELSPGRTASWHVHNGIVYFLVVRGLVTLQYEGRAEHYSAGDVYTEPTGVTHRALNPHPDIPAAFVGFWVTSVDRPHITEVEAPAWEPAVEPHPLLGG